MGSKIGNNRVCLSSTDAVTADSNIWPLRDEQEWFYLPKDAGGVPVFQFLQRFFKLYEQARTSEERAAPCWMNGKAVPLGRQWLRNRVGQKNLCLVHAQHVRGRDVFIYRHIPYLGRTYYTLSGSCSSSNGCQRQGKEQPRVHWKYGHAWLLPPTSNSLVRASESTFHSTSHI
jgi:hypothetical protein